MSTNMTMSRYTFMGEADAEGDETGENSELRYRIYIPKLLEILLENIHELIYKNIIQLHQ